MQRIEDGELSRSQALPFYINYFYHLLLIVSGLACFYAIVSGGILRIISGDSVQKVKESFSRMSSGVIGLLIMLSSYMILNALNPQLLILFGISHPITEIPPIYTPPPIPEIETTTFVEVPLGGLIEKEIRNKAAVVAGFAAEIVITSSNVDTASEALNTLSAQCQCSDIDTQNCAFEEEICPEHGGECLGDPCENVRADIEAQIAILNGHVATLDMQRTDLLTARNNLAIVNQWLKLAEALLRDSYYSPENLDSWLGTKEVIEAKGENVHIKLIWPHEIIGGDEETGSNNFEQWDDRIPPDDCNGDCLYEIKPMCARYLVNDTLYCYGNNYRCCGPTDPWIMGLCVSSPENVIDCVNPGRARANPGPDDEDCCPRDKHDYCTGQVIRECGPAWLPADQFPLCADTPGCESITESQWCVQFNGACYPVPSGGVFACGANTFGCGAAAR